MWITSQFLAVFAYKVLTRNWVQVQNIAGQYSQYKFNFSRTLFCLKAVIQRKIKRN